MKYMRISTAVLLDAIQSDDGKIIFSNRMENKIYDLDDDFRSKIILRINESVNYWHIRFLENLDGTFDADVFTENDRDFDTIMNVLRDKFTDAELAYVWKKDFRLSLFQVK